MTNPKDAALRQAREVIADSYDGQKTHADLHYHLAQQPTLAAKVHAATYERAAENVKRMESALTSIDAALAAVPTPAIVRPEGLSDEFMTTALAEAGVSFLGVGAPWLRRLIAWAMTRRAPVSDAAVKASEPPTIDDTPAALRAIGWSGVATEWELMQEVLAIYAKDESRFLRDEGEPYGSIPTEAGMKARQHAASFDRRAALEAAGRV